MIISALDRFDLSLGGNGTTQSRTGYTHSPKFIFAIQNQLGATSDDVISPDSILTSIGFATADLSMRSIAYKTSRSVGTVTTGNILYTDALFAIQNQAGGSTAVNGKWDLSSVDADGITVRVTDSYTFDTEIPSAQLLSLGGPAFAQIVLGTFTLQEPGAISVVTSPGFTPDGVLMIAPSGIGIGAAVRRGTTLAATSAGWRGGGGSNPSAKSYTRYGECIASLGGGTTNLKTGTLTNWRTDGFEVTSTTGALAATVYFAAFRMSKGFDCRILTGSTATTATTVNLTTSGGFTPKVGILASHAKAESAAQTLDADADLSIGMYQVNAQRGYAFHAADVNSNSGNVVASNDSSYLNTTNSDAFDGAMQVTSFGLNTLTGTMGNPDPVQCALWSLAFGTVPAPKGGPLIF